MFVIYCDFLNSILFPKVKEGIGATIASYDELQNRLLEAYLEERSDPVIGKTQLVVW